MAKGINILGAKVQPRLKSPILQRMATRNLQRSADGWMSACRDLVKQNRRCFAEVMPDDPELVAAGIPDRKAADLFVCFVHELDPGIANIMVDVTRFSAVHDILVLCQEDRPIGSDWVETIPDLPRGAMKMENRLLIPMPNGREAQLEVRDLNSFHNWDMQRLVQRLLQGPWKGES
jgi:hypothetical protein